MSRCLTRPSQNGNHGNCVFIKERGVTRAKKNSPRIEPGRLQVNTVSPEDDELAGKAAFIWQRVEPPSNRCGVPKGQRVPPGFANAFGVPRFTRQLELFALLSFR
jgi:hypothetical protein